MEVICLILSISLGVYSDIAAQPYAYISNSGDNTVSVIDMSTNSVTKTVSVGKNPYGIAVHPEGTYAYVANFSSNSVSVINAAKHTVEKTISVGTNPYGIAVNPAATLAYVTNYSDNTVSVIDLSLNTVTATINVGANPIGVAVNSSGSYVYIANSSGNTVSVIDASTNAIEATINVGTNPIGIAVYPSGEYVYVANAGGNSVSVIDTTNNTITATIRGTVISNPWGVTVNPAGTYGYVTSFGSSYVSIFNTTSNRVINNIFVGDSPIGVTINIAGTYTYVANYSDATVSVIDNSTNTVTTTITVGSYPFALGTFTAYGTAPSVTATVPKSGATDVSPSASIKATFSDTMDSSTITSSTFLLSGGITGTVTYNSTTQTATFKPSTALAKNTTYTATLTTGITNSVGTSLASNYTWSFTTSEDTGCFIATAVYGSSDDVNVLILRKFRDQYLLPHDLGAAIVRLYYRYSPPIAGFMREYQLLKIPAKMDFVTDRILHPISVLSLLRFRVGADHHRWKTNKSSGSKDNLRQSLTERSKIQKHPLLDVRSDKDIKGPAEDTLKTRKGGHLASSADFLRSASIVNRR
jgi:YVTN family beta-propeller protein